MERLPRLRHHTEVIRNIAKEAVKHMTTQPLATHGNHTFPRNHQEFIPFEAEVEVLPPNFHEVDTLQVDVPIHYDSHGFPVYRDE